MIAGGAVASYFAQMRRRRNSSNVAMLRQKSFNLSSATTLIMTRKRQTLTQSAWVVSRRRCENGCILSSLIACLDHEGKGIRKKDPDRD